MKKYNSENSISYECTNKCPICNTMISPVEKKFIENSSIKMASILLECPACSKGSISHYKITESTERYSGREYHIAEYIDSYPKTLEEKKFSEDILKTFPSFCEIYNQAYFAEQYNLNEIAGIGYRKALEFLIKDYCIYYNSNEKENIEKKNLSQVINDYITSDKIKNLAKASVWLGNDETHYTRKFGDKDIKDLKRFIDATLAYIEYEIISDEAEKLINS